MLLGFGLLALLGWNSVATPGNLRWFAYAPQSSAETVFITARSYTMSSLGPGSITRAESSLRDWPWAVLITVTLVGTVAWYAWRTRRSGGSVHAPVTLAVAGAFAVQACYFVVAAVESVADPAALVRSVGLPLLGLGVVTGGWAYFRLGPWRWTAATIGVVCLVTGVASLLGAWSPILLDPLLIAAGLLALARYERSRLLAAVAVAAPAALVAFPIGTLSMLIPAVIVLAAAIVALIRRSTPPASALGS